MTNVTVHSSSGKEILHGFLVANRLSPWMGWTRVYFEHLSFENRRRLRKELDRVREVYGWNFMMSAAEDYVDLAPAWRIKKEEPVSKIEDAQARIKRAQEELEAAQRDLEEANKPAPTPAEVMLEKLKILQLGTLFTMGKSTRSSSILYFVYSNQGSFELKIQAENGIVRTKEEFANFAATMNWDTLYVISEYPR